MVIRFILQFHCNFSNKFIDIKIVFMIKVRHIPTHISLILLFTKIAKKNISIFKVTNSWLNF